jgi:hypothetical protein
MFAEDNAAFLADFASPVIWQAGGRSTLANFDRPDLEELGSVVSTQYMIEYPRGALPNLPNGAVLLIGIEPGFRLDDTGMRLVYEGTLEQPESGTFRVKGTMKLDDGRWITARLERLT